jgi:predicted Zn-dependent protease
LGQGVFILWTSLATLPTDEVDAVLAHDIAHDRLEHSLKPGEMRDVTDAIGDAVSIISGADDETETTFQRWSGDLLVPRYNRAQELQADSLGVLLLRDAGYSDAASLMCRTFQALRATAGEAGGGYFDDHPGLSDRMSRIKLLYASTSTAAACS